MQKERTTPSDTRRACPLQIQVPVSMAGTCKFKCRHGISALGARDAFLRNGKLDYG